MGKSNLSGISNFFDDLETDQESSAGVESVKVQEQPVGEKSPSDQKTKRSTESRQKKKSKPTSAQKTRTEPVRLPTGRPPGKKAGEGPRKLKTSLWLEADLIDEYRERVYQERQSLGELIERALRAYKQENW